MIQCIQEQPAIQQADPSRFLGCSPKEFVNLAKPFIDKQGRFCFDQFLMNCWQLGDNDFFTQAIDISGLRFFHVDFSKLHKVISYLRPKHNFFSPHHTLFKYNRSLRLSIYTNINDDELITFNSGCIATADLLHCLSHGRYAEAPVRFKHIQFGGDMREIPLCGLEFHQCDFTKVSTWLGTNFINGRFYNGCLLRTLDGKNGNALKLLEN